MTSLRRLTYNSAEPPAMFRLDHHQSVEFCDGWRRRDFLHAGSIGLLSLSDFLALKARGAVEKDVSVIFLLLVGGPSQLDTWDMKPDAPSHVRGPYRPIRTNAPGVQISEIFPRLARHADKYAILRTLHHEAAAVHDTGHQMMQTGRLFRGGIDEPHLGCVVGHLQGAGESVPSHVVLPRPIGATGGNLPHGQSAGYLGKARDPFVLNADPSRCRNWRDLLDDSVRRVEQHGDERFHDEDFHRAYSVLSSPQARSAFDLSQEAPAARERYGVNRFGQSCLLAKRLVRSGVRFVTVNMFETVFDEITWDIHGTSPFSPIECYSDQVGPMFDRAFSALLEDLSATGELDRTLVVATGEFGRTPKINPAGGRDHWPQCWSMLMAGGGVQGGRVIGESDATGSAPKDRPVTPAEVAASVYQSVGIRPDATIPGPHGAPVRVVDEGVEPSPSCSAREIPAAYRHAAGPAVASVPFRACRRA